jgi:hypothetical protein
MLLACLIAGLAVWFVLRLINQPALIQGGIAGLIGVLIYFFLAWIFRLEELNIFFSSLVSKLPWKKVRE